MMAEALKELKSLIKPWKVWKITLNYCKPASKADDSHVGASGNNYKWYLSHSHSPIS